jgi:hypothetical protein
MVTHCLAFGVDRLAPAFRVLAPIGNEAPAQRVERHFAGLMIAPDHQQVLAEALREQRVRRPASGIVTRRAETRLARNDRGIVG